MGIIQLLHDHGHEEIGFFLYPEQVTAIWLSVWLALLGLALGSFIDCAVARWAVGEKMFEGRSRCLSCGHTLGTPDLIPVVSFLAHRGKCRYCGEKIPADCLAAELAGAVGLVCVGLRFGPMTELGDFFYYFDGLDKLAAPALVLAQWLIWAVILLALSLTDAAKRIIPDELLIALAVNRVIWFLVMRENVEVIRDALKACLVPAALLALVLLAEKLMGRELMGGGDIKLLFALALYLSWAQLLLTLMAGCLAGLVFAALARKKQGTAMPFGPFLAAGAAVVVCFCDPLIQWYFSVF